MKVNLLERDQGKLANIRNNIINGNKKDAYQGIIEYNKHYFPIDYIDYLQGLEYGSNGIIIDEARKAFSIMAAYC